MVVSKQGRFVRISPNPMRISGEIVNQGDEVIGDFETLQGLPGMQFIGWINESTVIPHSKHTTKPKPRNPVDDTSSVNSETKEKDSETIGFSEKTLKELKSRTPRQWMMVKKSELKSIMDEAGIDYSAVKDDRMALYKFLVDIIKGL